MATSGMNHSGTILRTAVSTRCLLLLLQFFSNSLVPDHDAGVFYPPLDTSEISWLDHVIHFFLGGVRRWDAVYFTHIAQYGYTYENCVAFFPLYPMVLFALAQILNGLLHISSSILLMAVTINILLFSLTALGLYRLGITVLGDKQLAYLSTLLFCINPANIFMTAPYSETLFFFLLVYAWLGIEAKAFYASSFLIGLSILTRSNGLVGIGFVLHALTRDTLNHISPVLCNPKTQFSQLFLRALPLFLSLLPSLLICTGICLSTFLAYQFYIYSLFCLPDDSYTLPAHLVTYGRSQNYTLLGDQPSPWCKDSIPFSYTYIQKQHWGVGLFKYYELKQIPNFLLALPVITLSCLSCLHFARKAYVSFFALGLLEECVIDWYRGEKRRPLLRRTSSSDDELSENPQTVRCPKHSKSSVLVPFVIQLAFLVLFGCTMMHIQVLTRMLFSSSPLLYWFPAWLFMQSNLQADKTTHKFTELAPSTGISQRLYGSALWIIEKLKLEPILDLCNSWTTQSLMNKSILVYFLSYSIIGTVLFSNFLPWT